MTAAYRVLIAERNDIATVTVICPECGSEVSLVVEKARIPDACPSCTRPYGEKVSAALAGFGRFQREAATAEEHAGKSIFRFSIKQAD
jgi:hypothetical protein